jgi:hypothetical protein
MVPILEVPDLGQRVLNCQALYTFIQLAGDAAVGLASINLAIRTYVRSLSFFNPPVPV